MKERTTGLGVELASAHTGSTYLHELILRTAARFPGSFARTELPHDSASFKQRYGDVLVAFEAARVKSAERSAIARFLCLEAERGIQVGPLTLFDHLARETQPLPLVRVEPRHTPELVPSISFEGKVHRGEALSELARDLHERRFMTRPARDALVWLAQHAESQGGKLSLAGERFVVMGAGAELAPTSMLLEAGAEVLWIDVREPNADELLDPRQAGVLHFAKGGADLLAAPERVLATVKAFADGAPVHLWLFAYAGGATQELRLTGAMNGIARAMPRALVKSLAVLVSPTTAASVLPEDALVAETRRKHAPAWKRALAAAGRLKPGQCGENGSKVSSSIVPIQGLSYQAAQYVGKVLAAEAWASYGNELGEQEAPMTVSANVAPITATRSLSHPVFEAAFLGAPMFDILIAKPSTTRALGALLAIHDVLNPEAPGSARRAYASSAERARGLLSQQVHGGVYAQPFGLEGSIAVAAMQGLAKRPKLALGLLR